MIRPRRAIARRNLEDDMSPSRSPFKSSQSRHVIRSTTQQVHLTNNINDDVFSPVYSRFQLRNLKRKHRTEDTSSESEDYSHLSRIRRLRNNSDYETGESSDRSLRSRTTGMKKKSQPKSGPAMSQQFADSDSSSDGSEFSPIVVRSLKRPLSPTSTSDSSDSGLPIASGKFNKRRRVFSSSSESSSDADDQNVSPDQEGIMDNFNLTQGSQLTISEKSLAGIPGSSLDSLGERQITFDGSESESDIESSNHTARERRLPYIQSEDDTGSSDESIISRGSADSPVHRVIQGDSSVLDNRIGRRRGRRNIAPHQEMRTTLNVTDSIINNVQTRQSGDNILGVPNEIEETEENFTPVTNLHRVRGRQNPVIVSEDDSESEITNDNDTDGGNEVGSSPVSDVINYRRRRVSINDEWNAESSYNLRRRNRPTQINHSEDESNSSDSDIRPRTLSNRIVPVIESDDSSSTSSSSSTDSDDSIPIRNVRNRNRPIPIADDYEDNDVSPVTKVHPDPKILNGNSSDTDGESEKCPICLVEFKLQEIGKPKSCDHKFCSPCIKEWATRSNTCPVDRKPFDGIIVYDKIEGRIISEVPVEKANPQTNFEIILSNLEEVVADIFTDSDAESYLYFDSDGDGPEEVCTACGSSNQPHRMISCDTCGNVYHLGCIEPPLRDFPTNNWYCSDCDESDSDPTYEDSDYY